MKAKFILAGILLLPFLSACTEQFWPELEEFNQYLVVDGMVTDQPGPYTIKLAYSGSTYDPISRATVFIVEEGGERHQLTERDSGEYRSDAQAFQGQAGKSYKLELGLPNGQTYESDFIEILDNPGIDTVTSEAQWRFFNELQQEIPGYQFFVTTNPGTADRDYFYLWQMEATYRYTADFPAYFYYAGALIEVENIYEYYTCWRTYQLSQMAVAETRNVQQKQVVGKPITFVKGNTKQLLYRYSLLTRQLSVDQETYEFWEDVIAQGFSSTALYTTQPYLIKGNIVNTQDPEEVVLGYFTVASVQEKRVYRDTPNEFEVTYSTCYLDHDSYRYIFFWPRSYWPIFVTQDSAGRGISGEGCIDCREVGGRLNPPDWWIE